MKIQLDTENKTIKLGKDVVLSKLIETLEKLLPNGEWKEFTLETHTVIRQWSHPVVLPSVSVEIWIEINAKVDKMTLRTK